MPGEPLTRKTGLKSINHRLYLTYIVQCLYGRYPHTEFSLKILPYNNRKSLRVSWHGDPEKNELRDFLEIYRGAGIDIEGIAEQIPALFSLPDGTIDLVYWGFDFIILNRSELTFI